MKKEELRHFLERNCQGQRNAIGGEALRRDLSTARAELQKAVNRLRREGVPVGSDGAGYFYCRTAGEVYGTIRRLQRMRSGLDAAIRGLEGCLHAFEEAP